ncbi:MAG: hypothetical protein JWR38_1486 [Mucilaginibacter sp.]|nr:hypothetical protein [Mucilaginibacter sp.]
MKTYILVIFLIASSMFCLAQTTGNKTQQTKDTSKSILKNIKLKEVVIQAKRPLLTMEIDKITVNVASMISSASSNTLEVLEKTPGVQVSASGDISLNGRGGVMVLIDGRQTYMSGQDLANYLKSIPGGNLDKIELMDNPPARYDAAGNGVINIRLKKNRTAGFTGSVSSGYTQGKFARNNDALNLNYNHKKINIFSNIGYSYDRNYTADTYNRSFYDDAGVLTNSVLLNNRQEYKSNGFNGNLGLDYSATPNTTYGFQVSLNHIQKNSTFNSASRNFGTIQLDSIGSGYTNGKDERTNLVTNLNLLHKLGKTGRELSADASYLHYTGNGNQSLQNKVYGPDDSPLNSTDFLYLLPSTMTIYTVKADYVHPLKNKLRIETGIKWSTVKNDNVSDYYQVQGEQQVIDNSQSNHFIYRENFLGAYLSAQKSWKQLGIQLGMRAEHTSADGNQLGNAVITSSTFSKDYTQLFPSLFINYKLDTVSRNTLGLMITRRINRPNYQLLNPFLFYRDQYSYSSGNPDLNPQYQYRYELKYQFKQLLRIGLSYNHFTNVIFQTTNVVDDKFITKPENVSEGYMLLLNTGLSLAPARWWNLNADVLLSRMGLNGNAYGEKLNPKTYVARINILNQLQFNKGWSAEFGGYYASRDLNGQTFTSGMFRSNAGIQKKVLKNKGSIRLSMDDIFHSWKYHNNSIDLKQAYYNQTSESDTRRFGIAFTYSFGSDTFSRKSKHKDNALDDEKGRM